MRRLLALAAACAGARSADLLARAGQGEAAVPAAGIGRRIRHLSYSDQGGRPDGVQVMVNRGHVYVGHMFSDGVTILDAADPRRLKPVGFFTAGANTRTHHLQVADDLLLLANGANIVAMQSYDNLRGYFENALADSITNRKKFRSGLSIHDISKPGEMREIAFLEIPGSRRQPAVVDRRPLRVPGGALRRIHGSHPRHRRPAERHEAGDRLDSGGCPACTAPAASRPRWRRASASRCIT